MTLDEFAQEIRQEVLSRCGDEEAPQFREDMFTEVMMEHLKEANRTDDGEACFYRSRGMKLNGLSFSTDGECLDLFVCCYRNAVPPENIPKGEIDDHFKWVCEFLERALEGLHQKLEEASAAFDAAIQIYEQRDSLTKVRLYFLTDGIAKKAPQTGFTTHGVDVQHFVWDMEELFRFFISGMQPEVISIDFEADFGQPIPCLASNDTTGEYRAFLAFFPGTLLADLYAKYGPRLLERNVRSFLSTRGKINREIRATILSEGNRFLAYNNGISATAEGVELKAEQGLLLLKSARDFQIVNGGQTTASIYHTRRKDKADVSKLVVQVKLTELRDRSKIGEFVGRISKYANSQNKINAADLSANSPYHVELEAISRALWAPALTGTDRQTRWYYERARGSYLDDKSREGTPAKMRAWEAKNPVNQKFTKTDLAKFQNTWAQQPHFVSLGAEKNFLRFTEAVIEGGKPTVDESYFQRLVAKTLLFRTAEKLVSKQNFGGFRAQIVTYTLAWLSHNTAQRIDLARIWENQRLSKSLEEAIAKVCVHANQHIVNPPPNRRNPSEWCKREECWETFRKTDIGLPPGLEAELITTDRLAEIRRPDADGARDFAVNEEVQKIAAIPADTWFKVSHWAKETKNLAAWQRGLSFSLGTLLGRGKTPSPKQARQGSKLLEEARRLGFKDLISEMSDVFTTEKRSLVMSRIRGRGNRDTELRLIEIFRTGRITGWRRKSRLFGKPDFIFPRQRVAVFVDGCFWHCCPRPGHSKLPKNNALFWEQKLGKNVVRDRLVTRTLHNEGWAVLRLWEHELRQPTAVFAKLECLLSKNACAAKALRNSI
jgi:DNA mismatch endonuclease Vsr